MAESRVIFLIVAAIIAGSILLLATNILSGVKGQVSKIKQIGEAQRSKFDPGGLYAACDQWLALQSERYNSEKIIELKLADLMSPYDNLYRCCGEDLKDLSQKCYTGENTRYCEGKYIKAEELSGCVKACENIKRIFEICENSCSDKVYSCMDYLISDLGRDICKSGAEITTGVLDRACGR